VRLGEAVLTNDIFAAVVNKPSLWTNVRTQACEDNHVLALCVQGWIKSVQNVEPHATTIDFV
jgi:hypothetical protein